VRPVAPLPTQEAAAQAGAAAGTATAAPAALRAKGLTGPSTPASARTYSGPGESGTRSNGKPARAGGGAGAASSSKEPGRNAPCPCGSGKKYKMCHGRPGSSL
jgi:preprotein translocase subunit SecA